MNKLLIILIVLIASRARAQVGISPVFVECSATCRGTLTLTNNSLGAFFYTVTPAQLHFHKSGPNETAADSHVDIKIVPSSGRLGPRSSELVDFEFKAAIQDMPLAMRLDAAFLPAVKNSGAGITIRTILPLTAYLCQKGKQCRTQMLLSYGIDPNPAKKK